MVDRALIVAAAQHNAARLDITRIVSLTGRSAASVHRALAGDAPHILAEIRRALGLAPATTTETR